MEREVVRLRQELTQAGFDAGPQTILFHLQDRFQQLPSAATIWRILKRQGLVSPQPHKRPKASFIRFEAALPNETWQCDATQWQLADGSPVEILNLEDDHSRLFLGSTAYPTVKAADVVEAFFSAADSYGLPASLSERQRRRLQRSLPPRQGRPRDRAREPWHRDQALHPLPPPDLRQG
jgi:hypothetical protein